MLLIMEENFRIPSCGFKISSLIIQCWLSRYFIHWSLFPRGEVGPYKGRKRVHSSREQAARSAARSSKPGRIVLTLATLAGHSLLLLTGAGETGKSQLLSRSSCLQTRWGSTRVHLILVHLGLAAHTPWCWEQPIFRGCLHLLADICDIQWLM